MAAARATDSPAGLRILGFSGLPRVRAVRDEWFADLDAREKRIFQGADAAAALVVGGRVVSAAAEERFNGVKHSEVFPRLSALDGLARLGIAPDALDVVAHSFSFGPEAEFYTGQSPYYRDLYHRALSPEVNRGIAEEALGVDLSDRFVSVPHHLAHAMSAYVPSGFDEALVVVSDGLGERYSATAFVVDADDVTTVLEVPAHSSLGILYGVVTHYLGFVFGDGEYKVMGLAPLGDPNRFGDLILRKWIQLEPDGRYLVPLLLENSCDLAKETYSGSLEQLEKELGPRREPGSALEQRHRDVAAGLQAALQAAQLHLLRHLRSVTGQRKLCLAGGVALNCVTNGMVLRSRMFDEVFAQPAAADDGAALGAALYASRQAGERPAPTGGTAFGPDFSGEECLAAANARPEADVQVFDTVDELVGVAASLIAGGKVVACFQGRMEFGPRALGNRSILADPRRADMRDHINALVKKRESFRPFAPAVISEAAHEFFDIDPEDVPAFAHMLFVADVRDGRRQELPATTHVDGSARVQAVFREENPRFWALIHRFGLITGLPVLLNTSFNVQGQPIVRTPEQAMATFLAADLDALVMDRMIVTRRDRPLPLSAPAPADDRAG
jgi:carbamoyltransferase